MFPRYMDKNFMNSICRRAKNIKEFPKRIPCCNKMFTKNSCKGIVNLIQWNLKTCRNVTFFQDSRFQSIFILTIINDPFLTDSLDKLVEFCKSFFAISLYTVRQSLVNRQIKPFWGVLYDLDTF